MNLHRRRSRSTICLRLGSRAVRRIEPFSRRSSLTTHRTYAPAFPGRRLKGFCTSIRLMNAVVESAPVHGGEYLLLLCMARYAADDGTRVFPSVANLAKDSRQNERTVQKQLRTLEAKGLIQRVGLSAHGTNNYRVVIHTPWPTATPQAREDTDRNALGSKTPGLGAPDSSSNTSKNRQERSETPKSNGDEALRAIAAFLPKFKPANRETR